MRLLLAAAIVPLFLTACGEKAEAPAETEDPALQNIPDGGEGATDAELAPAAGATGGAAPKAAPAPAAKGKSGGSALDNIPDGGEGLSEEELNGLDDIPDGGEGASDAELIQPQP